MALLPLLLVSLASTGIEIALTRYFAVASWSEYGYWVISIVMAGFALSGVFVALARDWLGDLRDIQGGEAGEGVEEPGFHGDIIAESGGGGEWGGSWERVDAPRLGTKSTNCAK